MIALIGHSNCAACGPQGSVGVRPVAGPRRRYRNSSRSGSSKRGQGLVHPHLRTLHRNPLVSRPPHLSRELRMSSSLALSLTRSVSCVPMPLYTSTTSPTSTPLAWVTGWPGWGRGVERGETV